MYDRFTDRARKVMQLANQAAQSLNHEYIGTEHILIGLLKEGTGVAANVLRNLNLDSVQIRAAVESIVQPGPDCLAIGKLPQTPRAKTAIQFAMEEARSLNHNYVGTEHLLLGLLREEKGVAAHVLVNCGVSHEAVRGEVLTLIGVGEVRRTAQPEVAVESNVPKTQAINFPGSQIDTRDIELSSAWTHIHELRAQIRELEETNKQIREKAVEQLNLITDYRDVILDQKELVKGLRREVGRLQVIVDNVKSATSAAS